MGLIRPEALDLLSRWREAAFGAALLLVGAWWAWTSFGFLRWFAAAIGLFGLAVLWQGLRRARFRPGRGGPGVVEVDERRITYFGPQDGGTVSVDALTRVTIRTEAGGPQDRSVSWRFEAENAPPLVVPASAEGAGSLFDAIAALPGADYQAVLDATETDASGERLVWERRHLRLH